MQKYKEINGNDYVKDSRTTINETMQSIQSMNSGTAFPTNNLFEGMKCYRTDLKKTYTLTDVENGTWVEDSHATLADEATHAASATKLATPRTLSLSGKAAGSTTFDGSANASINVTSVNADTASKLSTARKINITGNATGAAAFDGTSDVSINVSVSQAAHADRATQDTNGRAFTDTNAYMHISALADSTDFNNVKTTGIYYCTGNTYPNRPHNLWGILTVYSIGTVKQEYIPDNAAVYYTREYNNTNWTAWSKVNAANADTATKLATPRAISLTGNASGSANFDGSGNVSINTTVNESKHAAAADALNSMGNKTAIKDGTREPLNLSLYKVYDNGYPVPYGNLLSIGGAGGGELLAEWSGEHKGIGHLYYRNRSDTGNLWSDWCTVAFTSDINSFAPTKTGGGASGTWGINISGNADTVDGYHASDLLSKIYPVGSIYMSMSATNPHDLFGVGTWERISQGRMLLGADDSTYKAGATGGEATHTLTAAEMPAHSHDISTSGDHSHYFYGSDYNDGPLTEGDGLDTEGNSHFTWNVRFTTSSAGAHTHTISNSGGGAAHNNMPPYLVCYIWQRTA